MACASDIPATRSLALTLAGAAGFAPDLTVRKDYEMLGLTIADTPALLYEGQVIFRGLPRTEEIESGLKNL